MFVGCDSLLSDQQPLRRRLSPSLVDEVGATNQDQIDARTRRRATVRRRRADVRSIITHGL